MAIDWQIEWSIVFVIMTLRFVSGFRFVCPISGPPMDSGVQGEDEVENSGELGFLVLFRG